MMKKNNSSSIATSFFALKSTQRKYQTTHTAPSAESVRDEIEKQSAELCQQQEAFQVNKSQKEDIYNSKNTALLKAKASLNMLSEDLENQRVELQQQQEEFQVAQSEKEDLFNSKNTAMLKAQANLDKLNDDTENLRGDLLQQQMAFQISESKREDLYKSKKADLQKSQENLDKRYDELIQAEEALNAKEQEVEKRAIAQQKQIVDEKESQSADLIKQLEDFQASERESEALYKNKDKELLKAQTDLNKRNDEIILAEDAFNQREIKATNSIQNQNKKSLGEIESQRAKLKQREDALQVSQSEKEDLYNSKNSELIKSQANLDKRYEKLKQLEGALKVNEQEAEARINAKHKLSMDELESLKFDFRQQQEALKLTEKESEALYKRKKIHLLKLQLDIDKRSDELIKTENVILAKEQEAEKSIFDNKKKALQEKEILKLELQSQQEVIKSYNNKREALFNGRDKALKKAQANLDKRYSEIEKQIVDLQQQKEAFGAREKERETQNKEKKIELLKAQAALDKRYEKLIRENDALETKEQETKKRIKEQFKHDRDELEAQRVEFRQQQEALQVTKNGKEALYKSKEAALLQAQTDIDKRYDEIRLTEAGIHAKVKESKKQILLQQKKILEEKESQQADLHKQQEAMQKNQQERNSLLENREAELLTAQEDLDGRYDKLIVYENDIKVNEQEEKQRFVAKQKLINEDIEKQRAELCLQQEAMQKDEKDRQSLYKSRDIALLKAQTDLENGYEDLRLAKAELQEKEQEAQKHIQDQSKQLDDLVKSQKSEISLKQEALQQTQEDIEKRYNDLRLEEKAFNTEVQNIRKQIQVKQKQQKGEIAIQQIEIIKQQKALQKTDSQNKSLYKSKETALLKERAELDKRNDELLKEEQELKAKAQLVRKHIQDKHKLSIDELEKQHTDIRQQQEALQKDDSQRMALYKSKDVSIQQQQEALQKADSQRKSMYKSKDAALLKEQAAIDQRYDELKKAEEVLKTKEQTTEKQIQVDKKQGFEELNKQKAELRHQQEALQIRKREKEELFKSKDASLQKEQADLDRRYDELKLEQNTFKQKYVDIEGHIQTQKKLALDEIENRITDLRQQQENLQATDKEKEFMHRNLDTALLKAQATLDEQRVSPSKAGSTMH
jgi:hypothetical protein